MKLSPSRSNEAGGTAIGGGRGWCRPWNTAGFMSCKDTGNRSRGQEPGKDRMSATGRVGEATDQRPGGTLGWQCAIGAMAMHRGLRKAPAGGVGG